LPGKILILNIIGIILQYSLIVLLYYFLFRVLKLVYCEFSACPAAPVRLTEPAHQMVNSQEQAQLVVLDAGHVKLSQSTFTVGETASIGRYEGNDIVVNDNFVSHEHACITRYKHGFMLADLHSTNGTLLNNRPVKEEIMLKNGDLIAIGAVTFRFER
jgi:pSer/pThr/pTyr-binding forkhead associated (FHA) protein